MLNGLDLFSGVGGITIALGQWVRPLAYCESDQYCQAVLMSRMRKGELAYGPIWDDVRTLKGSMFQPNSIDIMYGGFPCQDISHAGTRRGLAGERSGLFFEIIRLTTEIRPAFVFLENVTGIVAWLPRIIGELTVAGYDCRWCLLSAAEVGAKHRRTRWWLLAHAKGNMGQERMGLYKVSPETKRPILKEGNGKGIEPWPATMPDSCGSSDGVPFRLDRLRAVGNAVVPRCAKEAFELLSGLGPRPEEK